MTKLQLKYKDHALQLHALLNGLLQVSFKLDTGHDTSNLSKEMADTRKRIEEQTGRPIVSKLKASDILPPPDRYEQLPSEEDDK